MEWYYSLLLLFSSFIVVYTAPDYDTASFYGASYVTVPLQEARSTSALNMRFKTSRPDALLFLAAGDTDYCLVTLSAGRITVRINLGSGETELSSTARLMLHDLVWHDLHVKRNDSSLTLTIDGQHVTRAMLSGRFHELNIHHGLFIGGLGHFQQLFLGLLDSYRGCLQYVTYNSISVFERAMSSNSAAEVHAVDWNCSEEFTATAASPITFRKDGAYLSFHENYPRKGGSFVFNIKTQARDALIMYATGPPSRSDFISLELRAGRLVLSMDDGDGPNVLNSSVPVSDGAWHSVTAQFTPMHLSIAVDEGNHQHQLPAMDSKTIPTTGSKKFLDLSGSLYIGGLEWNKLARALEQGVTTADKSLSGCLKHMTMNGAELGLHNPLVSKGVAKGCHFGYPCLKNPCIPGAVCTHQGIDSFRCECPEPLCTRQDFTNSVSVSTQTAFTGEFEVLQLFPVSVMEGAEAIVTAKNLVVTLDYSKFGVRKTGVLFHMVRRPTHGSLLLVRETPSIDRAAADDPNSSSNTPFPRYHNRPQLLHRLRSFAEEDHKRRAVSNTLDGGDVDVLLVRRAKMYRSHELSKKNLFSCDDKSRCMSKHGTQKLDDRNSDSDTRTKETVTDRKKNHSEVYSSDTLQGLNSRINPRYAKRSITTKGYLLKSGLHVHNIHGNKNDNKLRHKPVYNNCSLLFTSVSTTGRVRRDVSSRGEASMMSFTLQDVEDERVLYLHDGSESSLDSVTLHLELITQPGYILPSYLQVRHQLVLPVTVKAVNDPPTIKFSSGPQLRMARGSAVKITPRIVEAIDPDTPPELIKFTLTKSRDGYVKKSEVKDPFILSFTQDDINKGLISYVNTGDDESRLVMKVSDGGTATVPAILRIHTYELDVYLVNNTGINMVHGTSTSILPNNLSCASNNQQLGTEITYIITLQPRYGKIEILRSDGEWQIIKQFTDSTIRKHKIRYLHLRGNPHMDKFHFRLSALGKTWPDEYIFTITFLTISVEVVRNAELNLNAIQESFISEGYLYTVTHPKPSPRSEIVYTLLTVPKYGGIYLSTGDLIYQRRLSKHSNFTQDDITKGRLKYKLNYLTFSNFRDTFRFLVACNDHENKKEEFKISYESPPFDGKIVSEAVVAREGATVNINSTNLKVIGRGFSKVIYSLTKTPSFGRIFVIDERTRNPIRRDANFFSNREISSGLVFYRHDDSENFRDFIKYVAITEDARPNFQMVSLLRFEILPQNDNPPRKLFDRVLNIVRDSGRTVTSSDITYWDPDAATSPAQIQYLDIRIPNGHFYLNGQYEPATRFTQQDINDNAVTILHKGESYSKITFTVSDGSLHVMDYIEVVASEPYIEIVNNTGLVTTVNGRAIITNCNLSITTNVDTWHNEVIYTITEHPKNGHLKLMNDNNDAVESFTENAIMLGSIYYEHDSNEITSDSFNFRVQVQHISTQGVVALKVYPEHYWDELQAVHSVALAVEEGSTHLILPNNLNFYHPEIAPQEILYRILKPPHHGSLLLKQSQHQDSLRVYQFSQLLINDGRVEYEQIHRNVTSDEFTFEVTNGVTTSPHLIYTITILPRRPVINGGSFTVVEGATVVVPREVLRIILSLPVPMYPNVSSTNFAQLPFSSYSQNAAALRSNEVVSTAKARYNNHSYLHHDFIMSAPPPHSLPHPAESKLQYLSGNVERPFDTLNTFGGNEMSKNMYQKQQHEQEHLPELFQVMKYPEEGSLLVKVQSKEASPRYFTRQQLEDDDLMYAHNGSEAPRDEFLLVRSLATPRHHSDPYINSTRASTLHASDIGSGSIAYHHSQAVKVTVLISPENDEIPKISANTGVEMWQEDTVILNRHMLEVTDKDNPPAEIIYECSEPSNGYLAYRSAPGKPITSFSQEDINRSKIFFKQSGPLSGGFSFRASDGRHKTGAFVFTVVAMAINLTVTYNKHFEIFPLTTMVIERKNLHAHFNNPQYNESVFITIKQQPRAGRVVTKRPNGDWDFAGTFTQEQVDQGRVAYEHLRSPTSLQEFDDFVFDVESPPLKVLKRMVFNISVTIGNTDQMKRVLGFEPLIVSEGGTTSITQSNLNLSALDTYFARKIIDNWNPYLTIHISQLPIHGKLTLDGRSLYMQSNINSRDVDTGNLLYSHDHSDTLHDEIGIKIHIRSPVDTLPMLIFDNSLRIQISPINDKMFALERSSMTVVRYQTKHLSNKDLYTSDLDTPPEQIRYQIMSGPTNGKIIISNNTSSGLMFTQKDIESGNVRYINDGSNKSTKLSFQVSDGGHTPKYATFDIEVLPLKLELINHTQVSLTQTTSISRITKYHLAAIANLEQSVISYNITLRPRYGNIYINGKVVHEFDQTDINDGRVLYLQTEMSAGSDSFQVLIWIHDVVLPETKVHVVAEPLIKMHSLQAVAGAKVPITLYHLNATELSHITSTMPIYRIVRQPRLSIIKRETVDANEIFNSVEVDEFTHAELIASKIFLYVKNMRVDPDHSLTDAMHYILIASGADVQPASGILTIAIHPVDSIILNSVDNPRQLRPSNVPSNNERTSNEGNNILLSLVIAMIVTLVVTLVIILIVALFCSKFRIKLSKNDMRKEFDVISLPPPIPSESRPESFMTDYMSEFATFTDNNSPNTLTGDRQLDCHTSQSEASFPSDITRELSSRDLTVRELSPSLPQCKVTPIFTNDPSIILPRRSPSQIFQQTNPAASSSSATTGHHTNGPEEWNPYEQTNNINSPMLRKNQYWV